MPKKYSINLADFNGIIQKENQLFPMSDSSNVAFARDIKNFRPAGGLLSKIKGYTQHSTFQYKMADRPVTLIRWSMGDGTKKFLMTAWDNLFLFDGDEWDPLLESLADSSTNTPRGTLVNPNNTNLAPDVNMPFDWLTYNDVLYLTDGYNYPIKYDGTNVGTWGYRQLIKDPLPITATDETGAGGTLDAVAVRYKVSLYDSTNDKEGNASSTYVTATPSAGRINIYLNDAWDDEDAYEQKNDFADKVRIYRAQGDTSDGAATNDSDYYLLAELDNVPIIGGTADTVADNGDGTGTLTYSTGGFGTADELVGFGCRLSTGSYSYITAHTDTELTLADMEDITDFNTNAGNLGADKAFRVMPGVADDVADITANGIYFGDDTTTYTADQRDHSAPPICKVCASFGSRANRVFMAGDSTNPNRLYFSDLDEPDYFPLSNWIDIDSDDGDEITALISFQGRLLIFKRNSVAVGEILGDPVEWTITAKYLSVGCEYRNLVVNCDGILIFVNKTGVYGWDGSTLKHLSHIPNNSNIKDYWDRLVVKAELDFARAVYHKDRNEFWLTCTLDDPRDLYDSSLTGYGELYNLTTLVADDGGGTPQNNGTFVFTLKEGNWFFQEAISSTAWCVFNGKGDNLELLGGSKGFQIQTFDDDETTYTVSGYACGQATGGDSDTLIDSSQDWDNNEWSGGTLYHYSYTTCSGLNYTIESNDSNSLDITTTFKNTPVEDDFYSIMPSELQTVGMDLYWQSPEYVLGNYTDVKQLFDGTLRVLGEGVLNISYSWGAGDGGSIQVDLNDSNTTLWGEAYYWDGITPPDEGEGLTFATIDEVLRDFNFPQNKGRQLTITMAVYEANYEISINLFSLGWRIRTNSQWSPR